MNDTPEFKPARKKNKLLILTAALLGLFALNVAAHYLMLRKPIGWVVLLVGIALLAWALRLAAGRADS